MEVLQNVKQKYPQLPVIMVSVQPENQYASRCLRAGAAAYVNKDNASEELAATIRKILGSDATLALNPDRN